MIKITFPDGSVKPFESGITPMDVAKSISEGLARNVISASYNGTSIETNTPLNVNGSLILYTWNDKEGKKAFWHSTAHVLAQALEELYPGVKLSIGPAIENGFYYDFDVDVSFSDEVLAKIEQKMKELAKSGQDIVRQEMSVGVAVKMFAEMGEPYKVEIIGEIDPNEVISSYTQNDFTDLCRGPHVSNTKKIKYFKLLSTSGAYWRGDENNKMLQRIYGTVFASKDGLKTHLHNLEEAKKRDHRKLGKELQLFAFDEEVGPGLPLWLPNGTVIIEELEQLAKDTERKAGYDQVRTPHLTKGSLYEK